MTQKTISHDDIASALNKLEAQARAATPGPWVFNRTTETLNAEIAAANGSRVADLLQGDVTKANSEYIAAANPATLLALIALVREPVQEARLAHAKSTLYAIANKGDDPEMRTAAREARYEFTAPPAVAPRPTDTDDEIISMTRRQYQADRNECFRLGALEGSEAAQAATAKRLEEIKSLLAAQYEEEIKRLKNIINAPPGASVAHSEPTWNDSEAFIAGLLTTLRQIKIITYEVGPPAGSEYFTIREMCSVALRVANSSDQSATTSATDAVNSLHNQMAYIAAYDPDELTGGDTKEGMRAASRLRAIIVRARAAIAASSNVGTPSQQE